MMRRAAYLAGVLGLFYMLVMQGCKVGPNYQQPTPLFDSTAVYRFDPLLGDTVINLSWWELFRDPQLKQLIEIALEENQDILIATSRIEEARAFLGFTRADVYPNIQIQAQAQRSNLLSLGGINEKVDVRNNFFVAPALSWEIDFWGKLRRANEAAYAEMLATEYGRRAIQVSLISGVAATYFQLIDLDQRLEIALRTLDSRREYSNIIEERFNEGYTAQIDLDQARIQEYIAEAAVPFFERQIAFAENALSVLLGRPPASIVRGLELYDQPTPPDIPSGIPSDLLLRRPDVLQVEQLLVAQNARIGVAVAQRFPSISLTASYGFASNDLSSLFSGGVWSISGSLLSPLFNFGKNKRRVEIERQRTEQVLQDYQGTVIQAFREVEDALISVQTYRDELNARFKQRASATSAKELSRERYDGGVTSYLEVLENDRSLFEAELNASEVQQLYLNSFVNLYKALGGGWISEEERTAAEEAAAMAVEETND
jgi:multidrug efflux system outer membrane protein